MKKNRHEKIIELIEKYPINTQDELTRRLREEGYEVTQATASRDIHQLGLVKVREDGVYRYALPTQKEDYSRQKTAISDSITQVDYAGNIILIRTYPGLAQAIAFHIDNLKISGVMGCVAGDDTIMVLVKEADHCADLCLKIRKLIAED
ncbi:MAG: arginine repressor [Clostridia bacterium]|nr:arginine repressor [Clostridia bacterium]